MRKIPISYFVLFYFQVNADTSWERSQNCSPCSQHTEREVRTPNTYVNGQMELSFSNDSIHAGSVKVSDAIDICKAQLLKQSIETSSQAASFHQMENTCL